MFLLRGCLSGVSQFSGLVSCVFKRLERKNNRNRPAKPGWLTPYKQRALSSTGDARIKDLFYKELTLISVLFLITLNAFFIVVESFRTYNLHPIIYYFSSMFFEMCVYCSSTPNALTPNDYLSQRLLSTL